MERSCVVYCIPCGDCPASYVEETKTKPGKRVNEYKRAVHRVDIEVSALAEHAWSTGHEVDWKRISVLDYNHDLYEQLILEACHIRKQSLPLNRDEGRLPGIYNKMLRDF